jgi:hypothetical protein
MKNSYEIRGDITAIYLNQKDGTVLETLIDTSDLPIAQEFPMTWYAYWHNDSKTYYVKGNTPIKKGKRTIILLHRWLTKAPKGKEVDHFNHNGLDNRRNSNLRIVTTATELPKQTIFIPK